MRTDHLTEAQSCSGYSAHERGVFLVVRCDGRFVDVLVVTVLVFLNINPGGKLDTIQITEAVDTAGILAAGELYCWTRHEEFKPFDRGATNIGQSGPFAL